MTHDASPPPPHAQAPPVVSAEEAWPPLPDGWWRGTAPHATFPVPYTLGDAILVAAWSLLGQFVFGLPLGIALVAGGVDPAGGVSGLSYIVAVQVLTLTSALFYLRLRRQLDWRLWGPIRPAASHVLWGIGVGIAGFLGIQVLLGIVLTLLGDTDPPQQALLGETGGGTLATVLLVLVVVVLAPVAEEVFYRGVLFQALRRRIGLWPAATSTSVLFGVIHLEVVRGDALPAVVTGAVLLIVAAIPPVPNVVRIGAGGLGLAALAYAIAVGGPSAVLLPGGLAALGFVFALSFHRTGNLLVPIVGHAVFNGIAISIATFAESLDLGV